MRAIDGNGKGISTLSSIQSLGPFPDDFTRGIAPKPCHSHNDYWRDVPLLSALAAGCVSVEGDIWVSSRNKRTQNASELYVGHTAGSLRPERTLRSLYIDPLLYILDSINTGNANANVDAPAAPALPPAGVFDASPNTTLVLFLDFKDAPEKTNIWDLLQENLQPLRERRYLTYWNATSRERVLGPITIVASGHAPFDLINDGAANAHRDVFFDAPLESLTAEPASSRYSQANSYYASVSLSKAVGRVWFFITEAQLRTVAQQVENAKALGLLSRYWDTPGWPVGVRNRVWEQLVWQAVGVLNVDELWTATTRNWRLCSSVGWGICP